MLFVGWTCQARQAEDDLRPALLALIFIRIAVLRPNLPCRASDGVQQAKEYATILGLRFATATNGQEIIEIDLPPARDPRSDL